jgi:hypothetical protein
MATAAEKRNPPDRLRRGATLVVIETLHVLARTPAFIQR